MQPIQFKGKVKQKNNFHWCSPANGFHLDFLNFQDNVLITAGEGGIVTAWSRFETSKADSHKLKEKVKSKAQRKSKPY